MKQNPTFSASLRQFPAIFGKRKKRVNFEKPVCLYELLAKKIIALRRTVVVPVFIYYFDWQFLSYLLRDQAPALAVNNFMDKTFL
jgi:hypothetical protein